MNSYVYKRLLDPWIGAHYTTSSIKLLLIGESHYAVDKDGYYDENCEEKFEKDPTITIKVINEFLTGSASWRFFENTTNLFTQKDAGLKHYFWQKIAYYTLIQKPMHSATQRPSQEDFREYQKLIFPPLESFKENIPTHVIFLGNSSERHFNSNLSEQKDFELAFQKDEKVGRYSARFKEIKFNGKQIKVAFIKHPSSYFSSANWFKYLHENMPELIGFGAK